MLALDGFPRALLLVSRLPPTHSRLVSPLWGLGARGRPGQPHRLLAQGGGRCLRGVPIGPDDPTDTDPTEGTGGTGDTEPASSSSGGGAESSGAAESSGGAESTGAGSTGSSESGGSDGSTGAGGVDERPLPR
jgi:hypothetical protein